MVRKSITLHISIIRMRFFWCTSKLENCSRCAQFCAVKMPPRLLMSNSTITTDGVKIVVLTSMGWKVQVWCTTDHTQHHSWVWSDVPSCTCEHSQLWYSVALMCIVKSWASQGVAGACGRHWTPSHVGCVYSCLWQSFACVRLHLKGCVSPRLKHLPCIKTLDQGCMSVIYFSANSCCNEGKLFHYDTLSDSIIGWLACLIQLQLSSFLIVGLS